MTNIKETKEKIDDVEDDRVVVFIERYELRLNILYVNIQLLHTTKKKCH